MRITLYVSGEPKAQPRQRHRISKSRKTGKAFTQNYTPKNAPVQQWKSAIELAAITQKAANKKIEGPIVLYVAFFMPIPKSRVKTTENGYPHIIKPDADNLGKAVKDALSNCGVWKDDCQVYSEKFEKVYHQTPGATIVIDYEEKQCQTE